MVRTRRAALAALVAVAALAGCSRGGDGDTLTLYSGRSEFQVKPVIDDFTRATGIKVRARYGGSAELAAQIAEEGRRSPADLFWSQDAGALGAVDSLGLLGAAPEAAAAQVPARFRAPDGTWVGVSGRARVVVYNPGRVAPAELPSSVFELTDPGWKGRLAIAPTNASFQAFVTAMRVQAGTDRTRAWLEGVKANEPRIFEGNALIVRAVNDGTVDLGLVNHYYLFELGAEVGQDNLVARNHFTRAGDPGTLVNVAGVGVMAGSPHRRQAEALVEYLLSPPAQEHFAGHNFEYPLIDGVDPPAGLTPLDQIESPDIDLADLAGLDETLALLRGVGLL